MLADAAVKARMAEIGSEIFTGSPADFGKLVAEGTEKWAKVVKFAGNSLPASMALRSAKRGALMSANRHF